MPSVRWMRRLSRQARRRARRGSLLALSMVERVAPTTSLTPPRIANFVGAGDFEQVGADFLDLFRAVGGLKPHHAVLDIGCGIGRMAAPLTSYLDGGRYEGFDVVEPAIRWCQRHIGDRHPDFRFTHVDVYNRRYNEQGSVPAAGLTLPYADQTFDFAFATSVFTHMLPHETARYLVEARRVLRPTGRLFATYFLVDAHARRAVGKGVAAMAFRHERDGCLTVDADEPEAAVAYPEDLVRRIYGECRLRIVDPVHHGSWASRRGGLTFQDIVVADRV